MKYIGIDFGSQNAGTTVICYIENKNIKFISSEKNKSADDFLVKQIKILNPEIIFIDAPLSLPQAYFQESNDDYFYRICDKELKAMSPMFLGGLTARAIKLKNKFKEIQFIETYPSYKAEILGLKNLEYKKENKYIPVNLEKVVEEYHLKINPQDIKNWHYFDSLLCYLSGIDYSNNKHLTFGEEKEGLIIV